MADLTFQEINSQFNSQIFSLENGEIFLNCSQLTGENYASINDDGIIEICFKLLKVCQESQTEKNKTLTIKLSSFGNPFYSTVSPGNPPTITGTASVSAVIPLNIDQLSGTN